MISVWSIYVANQIQLKPNVYQTDETGIEKKIDRWHVKKRRNERITSQSIQAKQKDDSTESVKLHQVNKHINSEQADAGDKPKKRNYFCHRCLLILPSKIFVIFRLIM